MSNIPDYRYGPDYGLRSFFSIASARPNTDEYASDSADVPYFLALWLPLLLLVTPIFVGFAAPDIYNRFFDHETGLVENLTVILAISAILVGIAGFRVAAVRGDARKLIWFALFSFACILFAGEELSWGQHIGGWSAGGIFAERGQAETNLHNIHPFIARASRALVIIAILLAGVILPLTGLGQYLTRKLPGGEAFWGWALPAKICAIAASLTLLVKLPKRLFRWTGNELEYWPGINDNEMLELLVAQFMLVYAVLLYRRLRHAHTPYRLPIGNRLSPAIR